MKQILSTIISVLSLLTVATAQESVKNENTIRYMIGFIGKTEKQFLTSTTLNLTADTLMGFRRTYNLQINSEDLSTVEYYFTGNESRKMYEVIIEFSGAQAMHQYIDKMFGTPNYPEKENHWILKGPEKYTCVAWAFNNKFVVATNLPGSEWEGEAMFNIPSNFKNFIPVSGKN